jgi:hypothetical protein
MKQQQHTAKRITTNSYGIEGRHGCGGYDYRGFIIYKDIHNGMWEFSEHSEIQPRRLIRENLLFTQRTLSWMKSEVDRILKLDETHEIEQQINDTKKAIELAASWTEKYGAKQIDLTSLHYYINEILKASHGNSLRFPKQT